MGFKFNPVSGSLDLTGSITINGADEVEEYTDLAAFPTTGNSGIVYLALDDNKIYRWSGSTYVELSPGGGADDQIASEVPVTPVGGISATDVQGALEGLDYVQTNQAVDIASLYSGLGNKLDTASHQVQNLVDLSLDDLATGKVLAYNDTRIDGKLFEFITVGSGGSYSAEVGQDDVGRILVDTDTIDLTYDDGEPAITADVRTTNSLTSDMNGIKLVNDESAPAGGKYYGTNSGGTKGYHALDVVIDTEVDTIYGGALMGRVDHGTSASVVRPDGFYSIQWVGSVEPLNATDHDTWIDTSA